MRIKNRSFISLMLAVMLSLGLAMPAMALPQIPHAFYGTVTVGDEAAPEGVLISAKIGGVEYATTNTLDGKYGYSPTFKVSADDPDTPDIEGGVEGDTIEFYIEGVPVASYTFANGEVTELGLEIEELPQPSGTGGVGRRDTTAPRISDIAMSNITETTADICWTTHEKSDSQVEYWRSGHKKSPLDEDMVINHHVQLTGLIPGTTYYYKTMSRDAAGNLGVSDEYTFTTLGIAPTPTPTPTPVPTPTPTPTPVPTPTPTPPPTPPPAPAPPEVINWPVVGGIIAGVVVLGLLIFFLVRRRAA